MELSCEETGESFYEEQNGSNNLFRTAGEIEVNEKYTGQIAQNDDIDIYIEQEDDCEGCTCDECHCVDEVLEDGRYSPEQMFITNDEFAAYPPSVQNNIERGLNSQIDPSTSCKPLYTGQIERDSAFIDYMTERFRDFAIDFVNYSNETNAIFGLETIKKVDMIIDMRDKK